MTKTNDLLRLDLQFFAEEPPAEPEVPEADKPEDKPEPKVVTMTQEELDALIGREKGRVKGKYADYDDLKAKISEFETKQAEQEREKLSEVERLQADLAARDTKEQELAQQLEAVRNQAKQERIRNAFIQSASTNNVAYVEAALKLADLSAVEVGEDGTVIGVDELMKSLVTDNPFLVAKKQQMPVGDPSNPGKSDNEKTSAQLLEEAAEKARKTGKPADRAAYASLKRELGN